MNNKRLLNLVYDSKKVSAPHAAHLDVTGVLKWFSETDEQRYYDVVSDFPSLALPWPSCWMEGVPGKYIKATGEKLPNGCFATGVSAQMHEIEAGRSQEALQENWLGRWLMDGRDSDVSLSFNGEDAKWMLVFQLYVGVFRQAIWVGRYGLYLNEMGRALDLGESSVQVVGAVDVSDEELHMGLSGHVLPFLFALSLMHCKNIEIIDTPVPPKVAAKRAKRGIPEIKFKTLVIEPMRKQIRREKAEDGNPDSEIKRALHICRGHFKDYTERPLFGRHTGVYWVESHVRGSAKNGTIVKDYKVNAPQ